MGVDEQYKGSFAEPGQAAGPQPKICVGPGRIGGYDRPYPAPSSVPHCGGLE